MKRKSMLLLAIAIMLVCSIGASAAHVHEWWDDYNYDTYDGNNHKHYYVCYDCGQKKYELEGHNWSSYWDYKKYNGNNHVKTRECYDCGATGTQYEPHTWKRESLYDRHYNNTYHYACYECTKCYEQKFVLEKHELETIPSGYSYWNDNTCNAEYRCKDCYEYIKKPTTHNWQPLVDRYEYSYVNTKYHKKDKEYECRQCKSSHYIGKNEKHTLKYYKSGGFIYYGCKKCSYNVGNKMILAKWTSKTTVKKGKQFKTKVPLLAKDNIKSIKITSGKKLLSVKKKPKAVLQIKAKKKGTAKIKATTKSGAVYTYVIKIK